MALTLYNFHSTHLTICFSNLTMILLNSEGFTSPSVPFTKDSAVIIFIQPITYPFISFYYFNTESVFYFFSFHCNYIPPPLNCNTYSYSPLRAKGSVNYPPYYSSHRANFELILLCSY